MAVASGIGTAQAPATLAARPFDLDARRREHWAWQPVRAVEPPAVQDPAWPSDPIDRFVLARLEAAGLAPSPRADRATLLRRVSFDLTGLPPPPERAAAFARDASPDAYARVVDELLASPRFGERWARHWLDLVRYAETRGHEFDYAIHDAWRYRDYVVRALNADIGYDQLVREHIAGDLLPEPRRHPEEGFDESVIGTAFYWFGAAAHSPVDAQKAYADRVDNQIDVLTKTFLGLTVSCARCHDHKFDAISTRDYYALAGIVQSSRWSLAPVDDPAPDRGRLDDLAALRAEIGAALGEVWSQQAKDVEPYLLAARQVAKQAAGAPEAHAEHAGLDVDRLRRFVDALAQADNPLASDPTAPQLGTAPGTGDVVFCDFDRQGFDGWFVDGPAFEGGPRAVGASILPGANGSLPKVRILSGRWAHSGRLALRAQGSLSSPTFQIHRRFVHVLAAGRQSRFNIVVDGHDLIRAPIYGALKQLVDSDAPRWYTVDVGAFGGRPAYLQLEDLWAPDPADSVRPGGYGDDGYLAVRRVVFSDAKAPPARHRAPLDPAGAAGALRAAVAAWRIDQDALDETQAELLDFVVAHALLDPPADNDAAVRLCTVCEKQRVLEADIPRPPLVAAMSDGTGQDAPVLVRGDHRNPGEAVPRRFLEALDPAGGRLGAADSGRLGLAHAIADPHNPLTARVIVNRVWHHLTGRGIVPTVDNLGVLGEPPSHPQLLDWLAARFVADGWSIKRLCRRIVLSSTYRMSSRPSPASAAARIDPDNRWLHRMRVRRLEAEALRDAILAVSGALDLRMYGPGVPVHLTPFMDGRGRPDRSGPLDGEGRRSLYLEVRRNFLSPLSLAFDVPLPASTVGCRGVSNVPAQALILMNDPFVHAQAAVWAERVLAEDGIAPQERVRRMYLAAFAREATAPERDAALAFVAERATECGGDRVAPWADLCHVLFNVKEFVFLP